MKESPRAVQCSPVAMVLPGHGRALTWHIKHTPSLCPGSAVHGLTPLLQCPIQNQGSFCGAGSQFTRIVCFLQKSEEHSEIFLLSIPECVHMHNHTCLCVWKWENPWALLLYIPISLFPHARATPSGHSPGQDSQGVQLGASNQLYWKNSGCQNNQKKYFEIFICKQRAQIFVSCKKY